MTRTAITPSSASLPSRLPCDLLIDGALFPSYLKVFVGLYMKAQGLCRTPAVCPSDFIASSTSTTAVNRTCAVAPACPVSCQRPHSLAASAWIVLGKRMRVWPMFYRQEVVYSCDSNQHKMSSSLGPSAAVCGLATLRHAAPRVSRVNAGMPPSANFSGSNLFVSPASLQTSPSLMPPSPRTPAWAASLWRR